MINQVNANVYEFNFTSINGKIIKLSDFKGKPILSIINGKIKMREGKIIGDPEGLPLVF